MIDAAALDILLHDRRIGTLARLDGARSIFTFDDGYLADEDRATLSLAYCDQYGRVINAPRAYQTKIEPFFSNLLPEGALRDYLARRIGLKAIREYQLLAQLGTDLPGAIKAVPVDARGAPSENSENRDAAGQGRHALRFSLAGVQLKFSALKNRGKNGGLTCSLVSVLRRNLLLSLAEAEFFRLRWSQPILDETERALAKLHYQRGNPDGDVRAGQAVAAMKSAFSEAMVDDFSQLLATPIGLPDPNDEHVIAAAIKTQAQTIVTENVSDFSGGTAWQA